MGEAQRPLPSMARYESLPHPGTKAKQPHCLQDPSERVARLAITL